MIGAVRQQAFLLVTAIQFLTRLPLPALPGFETRWLSQCARYFPLVGVLVGVVNAGIWWLARRVFPPAVAVGAMLAVSLLMTGALHEDGFADCCDGLGGGTTRQRILEIMKDSRIGAYGALGLSIVLGLKWTTLASLESVPLLVVSSHMLSRWCATALIWRLDYVRTDAAAKAKPFSGSLSGGDWLLSGGLGLLAVACIAEFGLFALDRRLAWQLLVGALVAAVIAAITALYCRQRIGGYTGDCLGAVQQLTELGFLMAALAAQGAPSGAGAA